MLRTIVALSAVALLATCAWLYLQRDGRRTSAIAPVREVGHEATAHPDAPLETLPDESDRTSAAALEPVVAMPEAPLAADPVARTGVLAGVVVVDGGLPLESIELRFRPDQEGKYESIPTDALGRFRRVGVREDWSGELILPVPYRIQLNALAWRTSLHVERPREDLVLEVERGSALRLRVLREDRTPAEGISVSLRLHDATGWSEETPQTDANGFAAATLGSDRLALAEVRAQVDDGANLDARFDADQIVPSGPYGDIDLGVLVLVPGRSVRLRILEPDGAPLRDTRVSVRGTDLRKAPTTDGDGGFELGLPRSAMELRIEAWGYLASVLTLPADVTEHEVHLRRASLLRVKVLDTQDRPWARGRLRLLADRPPFGAGNHFPPGFSVRSSGGWGAGRDSQGIHRCEVALDETGTAEIPGLETGLDVELEAFDDLGHVGQRERVAGLTETERREVLLRLTRDPCALDVRVVDPSGQPVAGAEVTLQGNQGHTLSSPTSQDGTIRFEGLLLQTVTVSARGQEQQENSREAVDPCAGQVTLVLQHGRSLDVEVRDEAGHRVSAGWLSMLDLSQTRSFSVTDGTSRFDGLPFEPLTLSWSLNGEQREHAIDASQESVTLEVPTLGEVVVDASAWTRVDREHMQLRFERLEPNSSTFSQMIPSPSTHVVSLLPGRYRLTAEVRRIERGSPPATRAFGAPREIVVEPGSTQNLTLEP